MSRRTPLYEEHVKAGAKIVEFAGYLMPIQYDGISAEHLRVRTKVGIFDVSHMGEVLFVGERAEAVVQRLLTNDVGKAPPGKAIYSPACLPSGGIVDDLIAYKFGPDRFLLCVNAANRFKDVEWFKEQAKGECLVEDVSDEWAQIAVQGPLAPLLLDRVLGGGVSSMKSFTFETRRYADEEVIVATTGYTGEKGGEVYVPNRVAPRLWRDLLEAGRDLGVGPAGLGARDTLRLEMCYCLYGHDIDETTTPLEAGLGWTVKFEKGDFIGRDALLRQKERGVERRLVPFILDGKGVPRQGNEIRAFGEVIGRVTSGAFSPSLGKGVGMGYVRPPHHEAKSKIEVLLMGKRTVGATVVEPPLYRRQSS